MGTAFERFDINADGRSAIHLANLVWKIWTNEICMLYTNDHLEGHDPNVRSVYNMDMGVQREIFLPHFRWWPLVSSHFWCQNRHMVRRPDPGDSAAKMVCLKLGYTIQMPHLIGKNRFYTMKFGGSLETTQQIALIHSIDGCCCCWWLLLLQSTSL